MAKDTIRPRDNDWPDIPDDYRNGADFDQLIARIHNMKDHELKLVQIAVAWAWGRGRRGPPVNCGG